MEMNQDVKAREQDWKEELIWVIHMKLFIVCLRLRILKTQILSSVVEDASLQLITTKVFQWEFGPPGGSWAECKEQKLGGWSHVWLLETAGAGRMRGKWEKTKPQETNEWSIKRKGGWLLVLKTVGRLGKKGMGCWMLSREGNYFWL